MIRRIALLSLVPLVLLLCGCWNGRAVLLFERPHWDTLGDSTLLTARLALGSLARGYLPGIRVVEPSVNPMDQLVRAAGTLGRGAMVVGPLLSYEWGSFATRFPGVHFILIGDIPANAVPPNVVVLSFDRTDAFRAAGRRAAAAARSEGGHVGVLTAAASDVSDAERDAFLAGTAGAAGASGAGDQAAPEVRTLPSSPDRAAVQAAVGDLHRDGATVTLLGLGSLDPWALEVMQGAGGRAVLADWKSSNAFPRVVLLSVEEDIPGGIARALHALSHGEKRAAGPVDLVGGGAAP